MERSSVESDRQNPHEERRIYVVDSLDNLNEQTLSVTLSQAAVWERSAGSAGHLMVQSSMRCPIWFFVILIITLIVSLALVSFVIILIVHTGDKMDEVSRKMVLGRKSIEELKQLNEMILQYLNQTELMEKIGNLSAMQTRQ